MYREELKESLGMNFFSPFQPEREFCSQSRCYNFVDNYTLNSSLAKTQGSLNSSLAKLKALYTSVLRNDYYSTDLFINR